jgi:hypothetical protein
MNCARCGGSLTTLAAARHRCPHCGAGLNRPSTGLVKTSSIRVAAGERDQLYRSIEELPPELRRKLRQAISGPQAETIIIADQRGRDEIFPVITGQAPEQQKKARAAWLPVRLAAALWNWRLWVASAGLGGLGLLLWRVWR